MAKRRSPTSRPMAWAELRFAIVGPLLAAPPPAGGLGAALIELALQAWRHPTDPNRQLIFGKSTIERWYYAALRAKDPMGALARKTRSDAGTETALSSKLTEALARQYGAHPGWSVQLHADNLRALAESDPAQFGDAPSYATVRRRMARRGWWRRRVPRHPAPGQIRAMARRESRECRSYEASAVHALWHYDFHDGRQRVIDAGGTWHTPILFGVLDDRSRICCHVQWYLHENAENLVHGLIQALAKRGLPRSVMSDNGAAMTAHDTLNGLKDLSISFDPTMAYSPEQNAKKENFWAQIEGRLMPMLERVEDLSLDFLNRATHAWVEGEYNHHFHSEINTTPVKRLLEGPDSSRPAPPMQDLKRAFSECERRTQRRSDGTISVEGVRFELPSRFRTLDREKNGRMRARRSLEPIPDGGPLPAPPADPIPPLLSRLLAEHAATGLPAAYLPKDELSTDEAPDDL